MKVVLDVYLEDLKEKVYRKIEVSENIRVADLCEYIIISLNGTCKNDYTFVNYSLSEQVDGDDIEDETLRDIEVSVKDEYEICYYDNACWNIYIDVISIKKEKCDYFKVVSGVGAGILTSVDFSFYLTEYLLGTLNEVRRNFFEEKYDKDGLYRNSKFDISESNERIKEYMEKVKKRNIPKNYTAKVSLRGLGKEITRTIKFNGNISLDKFCRCLIVSMNGDLSHLYAIKINKTFIESKKLSSKDVNYLDLVEKQKFEVLYDLGDNWEFMVTISNITDGLLEKNFEVIKAKGKGIVDDCGGVWGLSDLIYVDKTETLSYEDEWKMDYDINDYSIEEINNKINKMWKG